MTSPTIPLSPSLSEPPPAAEEPPDPRQDAVRALSHRLAVLLRPLRVLDAMRWTPEIEQSFLARGCKELPNVSAEFYNSRPLPFVPNHLQESLRDLGREIERRLGRDHAASRLLRPRCRQAQDVIELLLARGTLRFHVLSRVLYGGSDDPLPEGHSTLQELARRMGGLAACAIDDPDLGREESSLDAPEAARRLSGRLGDYFGGPVKVIVTDELTANAAVGGDCLKLHRDAWFSPRDVRLLEVHEGWVHLGTSQNARLQQNLGCLSRPLPSATRTQEGLAVWTEVLAMASHPARLRLLAGRVEAVAIAERGGDFLDVFRHFGELGMRPVEAYRQAARIFRGSLPDAGPFTKDLAYAHGFAEVGCFLSEAATSRRMGQVHLLFAGKVGVADLPALAELRDMGLISPPPLVPPPFSDLRALAAMTLLLGCRGR